MWSHIINFNYIGNEMRSVQFSDTEYRCSPFCTFRLVKTTKIRILFASIFCIYFIIDCILESSVCKLQSDVGIFYSKNKYISREIRFCTRKNYFDQKFNCNFIGIRYIKIYIFFFFQETKNTNNQKAIQILFFFFISKSESISSNQLSVITI